MARKVILDVDPGIDDAVAMALALFDPRLEVVAITAVAGNVPAEQATRNVQAIVEQLDPPRLPRIGAAVRPERDPLVDARHVFGADGLGNADFAVAELHHVHPSDKVITDEIRKAPESVTIVALGPLTNIATVFRRDPSLAEQVGQLIIMGGTLRGPGNVTPAAEFNIYCDPVAARDVFRSKTTKTLIPLDVTSQVVMTFDLLDQLPDEFGPVGGLLRRILPFSFRAHRQLFGLEGTYLHDPVALMGLLEANLFETERLAGDVEVQGELTLGATVFDRRLAPQWRPNLDVATSVDTAGVIAAIMRGLKQAAQ
ncbi:MAG TPA: nucleoside hydrolase [Pirellulales bacterium]|jgi:purine nucleosidase|nr:nucleoside hydrolase [Pirellulales bacterium]